MKHSLLFASIAIAAHGTWAIGAEAKPDPNTTAVVATNALPDSRPTTIDATAAHAELEELRTQMQALSKKMAHLSSELGDVGPRAYAFRYLGQPDRAMIGVVLAPDRQGVRIIAVTPDGAAARAGLHDGDVIVAINGTKLAGSEPDQGLAKARKLLADLKEGDRISLAYERGGKARTDVVLKAERREAWNWPQLMNEDPEHPFLPKDFDKLVRADVARAEAEAERAGAQATHAANDSERVRAEARRAQHIALRVDAEAARSAAEQARAAARLAMPWWGLNLAPVNPDLGRYFGVDKGALVLSTDTNALPGLRAGDVITRIAGEPVGRPEDALRALRDQPAGKELPITLIRNHKQLALNVKAPKFKSIFSLPPMPPAPPVPSTAPIPPAPTVPATAPIPPPAAIPAAPPKPPAPPPSHQLPRTTAQDAAHATAAVAPVAAARAAPAVPATHAQDAD